MLNFCVKISKCQSFIILSSNLCVASCIQQYRSTQTLAYLTLDDLSWVLKVAFDGTPRRLWQDVGVITRLALRVAEALLCVTETSVTRYRDLAVIGSLCNALPRLCNALQRRRFDWTAR